MRHEINERGDSFNVAVRSREPIDPNAGLPEDMKAELVKISRLGLTEDTRIWITHKIITHYNRKRLDRVKAARQARARQSEFDL